MDPSIAAFIAIVVLVAWAPDAIRKKSFLNPAVILLLVGLGFALVAGLMGALRIRGDGVAGFIAFLNFASVASSSVSLAFILFAILPDEARSRYSLHDDDEYEE